MEWKDGGKKYFYFLIDSYDSYSIKMEIPLKKHKLGEAAKMMEGKKNARRRKILYGI